MNNGFIHIYLTETVNSEENEQSENPGSSPETNDDPS